jgi:hypothetical protein
MKKTTREWVKKAEQDYVAVDTRYPGNNASKRQAIAALRWAERVRTLARGLLRIRERPRHS